MSIFDLGGQRSAMRVPVAPAPPDLAVPNTDAPPINPVALPSHLFQPRGAFTVDETFSLLVAPLTTSTLWTKTPGPGRNLRVKFIGFGSTDPTALVNATFSYLINGNPAQGYGQVPVSIGTLDRPGEVFLLAKDTDVVVLQVTNNFAGSSFTYIARNVGWIYQPGPNE